MSLRRRFGFWKSAKGSLLQAPLDPLNLKIVSTAPYQSKPAVAEWQGYCPICMKQVKFRAHDKWYRGSLFCQSCKNGSVPRERAMMVALERYAPNWRKLKVHESSPAERGFSPAVKSACPGYIATQFFPGIPGGTIHGGVQCENIEDQTFADCAFDVVLTQDVMEHVFKPDLAYKEIARTLKPGGLHIHTTPIYKGLVKSERRAELRDGEIVHLAEPEYHGNPVGDGRALVTFHYGYDLPTLIASWAPFAVEVLRIHDPSQGIVAEFLEVIICRKL